MELEHIAGDHLLIASSLISLPQHAASIPLLSLSLSLHNVVLNANQ